MDTRGWTDTKGGATVLGNFTNVSDHPIPFLLTLHNVAKDERYLQAAINAGEFSARNMKASYLYRGGDAATCCCGKYD